MTPLNRSRRAEAGFTLVEALIAMVVLIFGLIAVANLFVVAANSNQIGLYNTVAAAEANRVMERLKAVPFANLPAGGLAPGSATHNAADPWNLANWSTAGDFGALNGTSDVIVGGVLVFNSTQLVPGVGTVISRWKIVNPGAAGSQTRFIMVRSEVVAIFGRGSAAQFSTFRACVALSCP